MALSHIYGLPHDGLQLHRGHQVRWRPPPPPFPAQPARGRVGVRGHCLCQADPTARHGPRGVPPQLLFGDDVLVNGYHCKPQRCPALCYFYALELTALGDCYLIPRSMLVSGNSDNDSYWSYFCEESTRTVNRNAAELALRKCVTPTFSADLAFFTQCLILLCSYFS